MNNELINTRSAAPAQMVNEPKFNTGHHSSYTHSASSVLNSYFRTMLNTKGLIHTNWPLII
jgi:hypothetical protein